MFEIKYLVKNDIDNFDRVFDTEQEMREWIKSAEEELVMEKLKNLTLAKLNVPFADCYSDCDISVVKLNSYADYEIIQKYYELCFSRFGENYTEDPVQYPCIKILIETDSFLEFAHEDLNTLIHRFTVAAAVLANIELKEQKNEA